MTKFAKDREKWVHNKVISKAFPEGTEAVNIKISDLQRLLELTFTAGGMSFARYIDPFLNFKKEEENDQ